MIFYFSGTGNTEWAAKRLAQRTSERMIFIADEMKKDRCEYELTEGERLGFCFPVHGWQPPHIVRQFIGKAVIKTLPDTFVYVLVTCGDSIGRTMEIFENELYKHHGLQAHSVFSLIMPESYVCLPFMYTDSQQREREKTEHAAKQLEVYGEMIDKRQQGQSHTTRGATPWTFSHIIGAFFNAHMISDRKFTVDADLCIHCGKCQKVCPTDNIVIEQGLPAWQHTRLCTNCLACYHHCPRHAINYGSITRNRGQYFYGHSSVSAAEQP